MSLFSLNFFVFLGLLVSAFYLFPAKHRWKVLLLGSVLFVASWSLAAIVLLSLLAAVTYWGAIFVSNKKSSQESKLVLLSVIFAQVVVLVLFKYLNFFNQYLFVGLAFVIPMNCSYLIDVYRKQVSVMKNPFKVFLYSLYFPKLVAGPFEKAATVFEELNSLPGFKYERVVSALKLLVFGLFKKLVIADNLAFFVNTNFERLSELKGLSLVLLILVYGFQLFADFSGYTDIARAISRLFGIELLENFKTPYLATSLRQFWQRWHISFSTWLRDYVYFSLGGSRVSYIRSSFNVAAVFVVSALWHGVGPTFLIWGGIHTVWILVERFLGQMAQQISQRLPKVVSTATGFLITQSVVFFSWIFFRAPDLETAFLIVENSLAGVTSFWRPDYISATVSQLVEFNYLELAVVVFCLVCSVVVHHYGLVRKLHSKLMQQHYLVRFSFYVLLVAALLLLKRDTQTEFIYATF